MKFPLFKLEEYFEKREFKASYLLSSSDAETMGLCELLQIADPETRILWENLRLGYTESRGLPLLREEIARSYHSRSAEQILCFAGAEEGIFCACQAILSPSDHTIVVTPCYQSLESIPSRICPVTTIELQEANSWELPLNQIENAIRANTKLIIINYPHNPTGTLIDCNTQRNLVEIARKHDLSILSDEVYRLLEFDDKDRLPPIFDIYEKGMSLSVMSKAYGLAGLRVGWIAARDTSLIAEMLNIKHYLSICNSGPSEILSLIALRNGEAILSQNRKLIKGNLDLLDQFLERYSTLFHWIRPSAGCIGFMKLLHADLSVENFSTELFQRQGVLIIPAGIYGLQSNYFRIGFGRANFSEALIQFERYITTNLVH